MGKTGSAIPRQWRIVHAALGVAAVIVLLRRLIRPGPGQPISALVLREEPPFDVAPRSSLFGLAPPDASALRARADPASARTLFILPNSELRCHWQYNYFCKFYYSIRCYILAGFRDVRIAASVKDVQQLAKLVTLCLLHIARRFTPSQMISSRSMRGALANLLGRMML